jgi:C1A family cysteine protease/sorbitol-specific phosphotransferase system component IIBC
VLHGSIIGGNVPMNKKIFLLILFSLVFIFPLISAISNPSAVFCEQRGHEYIVLTSEDGSEKGYCDVNENLVEGWEYYRGNQETNLRMFSSSEETKGNLRKSKFFQDTTFLRTDNKINKENLIREDIIKSIPSSFDWRDYNGVDWTTPVRDQGGCGSCWAFSSAGVVETRINKDLNNATYNADLSEQDLVSCGVPKGYRTDAGGCEGIYIVEDSDLPFIYMRNTGIVKESFFGYTARDDPCSKENNWENEVLKISNYARSSASASAIKGAISSQGPVTAYMVTCDDFVSYSGGIYTASWTGDCGWHSMAIVGYNDAEQYWIVRNSWGNWGEGGYVRIAYSESVYNYGSWANDPSDWRTFFLDESYYPTGTDITTNPVLSSYSASTTYNRSNVPISFSINVEPKSLKYLSSVKINDVSMSGNPQTGGEFTLTRSGSDFSCTGETNCALTIIATDDAGRTSTSSQTIKIDDLAPRVTNFQINNQSYYVKGTQNLIFSANVEDADIDSVKLNNIEMSRSGTSYSLTRNPSQLGCSSDGICFFNITAVDKVGNTNNSAYKTLHIDDVFPVIHRINLTKDLAQTGERVLVIINATDNNAVSSVIADGTSLVLSEGLWKGDVSLTSSPLEVIVTDVADNIVTNNSITYTLDDTPPTLSFNLTQEFDLISQNEWHNHYVNLSLNATDLNGVASIEWRLANQTSWNVYSNPLSFSSNLPENRLIFRATDNVGNIAPSQVLNIKIDTEAPKINNVRLNINKTSPSGNLILFVNSLDSLSGIKDITATINENNHSNFQKINNDYRLSFVAPSDEGIYIINLSVEDNAGNINKSSITFEVENNVLLITPSLPSGSYVRNNTEITFTLENIINGTYNVTGQGILNIDNETGETLKVLVNENPYNITFNVTNGTEVLYKEFSYLLDTTPPSLIIENLPIISSLNGTYKISFLCEDSLSGAMGTEFYINSQLIQNFSSDTNYYDLDTLRLSNTNHTLNFICYDHSGNKNETEINISVNNVQITQQIQSGQVSFETTPLGRYVTIITALNSSQAVLSVLVEENIVATIPSDVNNKLIHFNITASAQSKSKVYFILSKDLLSGIDISRIKLWEKHDGDSSFKGPKSIVLVEERDTEYLFYFETDSYSEFLIGEQKATTPPANGGGGSGGGGGGGAGGGGGGGGGPAPTPKIQFLDENQIRNQQRVSLNKGEEIRFRLSNLKNHSLNINNITNNSVNITISSEPVTFVLLVGEEKVLNITNKDYYDLYVKLENITEGKANLIIQEINEKIQEQIEEIEDDEKTPRTIIIWIIVIIFLTGISYFMFNKKNKKDKDKKSKNKKTGKRRGKSKELKTLKD